MTGRIRAEQPADHGPIRAVHTASFPTPGEARLVDALREAGRLPVSLVARESGQVVGHVAFSPVTLAGTTDGIGLAPVAVLPAFRRRGIADRLIREGARDLQQAAPWICRRAGGPCLLRAVRFQARGRLGIARRVRRRERLPGTRVPARARFRRLVDSFSTPRSSRRSTTKPRTRLSASRIGWAIMETVPLMDKPRRSLQEGIVRAGGRLMNRKPDWRSSSIRQRCFSLAWASRPSAPGGGARPERRPRDGRSTRRSTTQPSPPGRDPAPAGSSP